MPTMERILSSHNYESNEFTTPHDSILAYEAYFECFHEMCPYAVQVKYSGKFRPYNAIIQLSGKILSFKLSNAWKHRDDELKKGLFESLLLKLFKKKAHTGKSKLSSLQLYTTFLQSLDKYDDGSATDPELLEAFKKVNEQMFDGMMQMPHLRFGKPSTTRLGSYQFGSNTVTISSIFKGNPYLLEYVLYHELLHKKFKYHESKEKTHYHTPEFRKWEKKMDREKELEAFLAQYKTTNQRKNKKSWYDLF